MSTHVAEARGRRQNRMNMKTTINFVPKMALALTLVGTALITAGPRRRAGIPAAGTMRHLCRRRRSVRRGPQHDPRAVRRLQWPALSSAAAVGRQDSGHRRGSARRGARPGCGRIRQRCSAGYVLRQYLLLDYHHLRPISQAQSPHPGAPRRIQRALHGWVQQHPSGRHGADHDYGPQSLRRLHRAGYGPAPRTMCTAPRWMTRRRGSIR